MASILNQVLWRRVLNHVAADLLAIVTPANLRGIIPVPHNATRINEYIDSVVNVEQKLYTVVGTKILFIYSAWINAYNSDVNLQAGHLDVKDSGDNLLYRIFNLAAFPDTSIPESNQYCPGLELVEGDYVSAITTHASMRIHVGFHSWLEDV